MPKATRIVVAVAIIVTAIAVWSTPDEMRRSLANKAVVARNQIEPLSWQQAQLAKIKSDMIARYNLGRLEGRALANEIQKIAHDRIKVGSSPGDLEGDLFALYSESVIEQRTSYSCQGFNLIFRSMLTAFDIPTRTVQIYAEKEHGAGEIVNSHSTADVFIDGRWEAMDATFNFHLENAGGVRLDWLAAYTMKVKGERISVVSDDKTKPGDPLMRAGFMLKRDMNYVAIIGKTTIVKPDGWDGIYRIKGRLHWSVAEDSFSADYNFPAIVGRD